MHVAADATCFGPVGCRLGCVQDPHRRRRFPSSPLAFSTDVGVGLGCRFGPSVLFMSLAVVVCFISWPTRTLACHVPWPRAAYRFNIDSYRAFGPDIAY